ncbi:hypothetical protein SAY86_007570 [Trapa natans]|uniref:Uncharacterized protein n=1 Tax=Trapa natans TaxID=22666 RepID=A0AAN7R0M4_TRANT|nr:hypothetical protein SAY86_007570 [Trapa natans]
MKMRKTCLIYWVGGWFIHFVPDFSSVVSCFSWLLFVDFDILCWTFEGLNGLCQIRWWATLFPLALLVGGGENTMGSHLMWVSLKYLPIGYGHGSTHLRIITMLKVNFFRRGEVVILIV